VVASSAHALPPRERTQFVLLSFDTTPDGRRLERNPFHRLLRALNTRRAPNAPLNTYTMFILSGGLQLNPARRRIPPIERPFLGVPPRPAPVVHYGRSLEYMRRKAANIRALSELGVEIGSHAVRHDHGRAWGIDRWRHEIRDHNRILDLFDIPHPAGFRAPFLEWNEDLYTALREENHRYDASRGGGHAWPTRHPRTWIWMFKIPTIITEGYEGEVLFFDDNMKTVLESIARARGLSGSAAAEWIEERFIEIGLEAFFRRYRNNRAPFLISGHGTMWMATIRLMRRICYLPDVRCGTFSEAVQYLEAHPELEGAAAINGQVPGWR
jgi:peptidoglycan/xylan/chitin deacetylase (PgdA/CDA1 family)